MVSDLPLEPMETENDVVVELFGVIRQSSEKIPSNVNFIHEKKLAAPMVIMPLKATN